MSSLSKYCLVTTLLIGIQSVAAVQDTSQPSLEAQGMTLLLLDTKLLKQAKKRASKEQKKIIRQALKQRRQGERITSEVWQVISQLTGITQHQPFANIAELHDHLLAELSDKPSVQGRSNSKLYHELLSKPMAGVSTATSAHSITLPFEAPSERSKWGQALKKYFHKQHTHQVISRSIPLAQLLGSQGLNIPQIYIDDFIPILKKYIKAKKALERHQRHPQATSTLTQDLLEETCERCWIDVAKRAKAMHLPSESLYLLDDTADITLQRDPVSGKEDVYIAVDDDTTHHLVTYGRSLVVHVAPPPSKEPSLDTDLEAEEDDEEDVPILDLYAHERAKIKNLTRKQTLHYEVTAFLEVCPDEETGHLAYYVYYQVYDSEMDAYHYYLWDSTSYTIEPISQYTFFEATHGDTIRTRVYTMTRIQPIRSAKPWISSSQRQQVKYIIFGVFLGCSAWFYQESPEGVTDYIMYWEKEIRRSRPYAGPINNGGLYNNTTYHLHNVCWLNSFLQVVIRTQPEILTNTTFERVNRTGEIIKDKLKAAMKDSGSGPDEKDMVRYLGALHQASSGAIPSPTSGAFFDASSLLGWYLQNQTTDIAANQSLQVKQVKEFEALVLDYEAQKNGKGNKEAWNKKLRMQEKEDPSSYMLSLTIPQQKTMQVQDLIESYQKRSDPSESSIGGDDLASILSIDVNTKSWKDLAKSLRIYKLKKRKNEAEKALEAAKDRLPELYKEKKLRVLSPQALVDLLNEEDKEYKNDKMNPERLTEILYNKERTSEDNRKKTIRAIVRDIQSVYNQIRDVIKPSQDTEEAKSEDENKKDETSITEKDLKTGDEELLQSILQGLREAGFKIEQDEKAFAARLDSSEAPINIDGDSNLTFRYRFRTKSRMKYNPKASKAIFQLNRFDRAQQSTIANHLTTVQNTKYVKSTTQLQNLGTIKLPTYFDDSSKSITLKFRGMFIHQGNQPEGIHWTAIAWDESKQQYLYFNDWREPQLVDMNNPRQYMGSSDHAAVVFYEKEQAAA